MPTLVLVAGVGLAVMTQGMASDAVGIGLGVLFVMWLIGSPIYLWFWAVSYARSQPKKAFPGGYFVGMVLANGFLCFAGCTAAVIVSIGNADFR